jgi:hypothetical protein
MYTYSNIQDHDRSRLQSNMAVFPVRQAQGTGTALAGSLGGFEKVDSLTLVPTSVLLGHDHGNEG